MRTIEYAIDGEPISDASAMQRARAFFNSGDLHIKISSEVFILAVRVLIFEGVVSHKTVQFLFNGAPISPDRNGRLPSYPRGFCDTVDDFLMRLM